MRVLWADGCPATSFARETFNVVTMEYSGKGWKMPPPERKEVSVDRLTGEAEDPTPNKLKLALVKARRRATQMQEGIDNALLALQKVMVGGEVVNSCALGNAPLAMERLAALPPLGAPLGESSRGTTCLGSAFLGSGPGRPLLRGRGGRASAASLQRFLDREVDSSVATCL
mmetsp:Transcript_46231/g.93268  ORF Transcript_46231/g.93268 Transcript_46231/m.93268 type:complete len:171 (-) Transcript_46231:69-581(-)